MQHHRDLLDADYWKGVQQDINNGRQRDVFPYSTSKRFRYIYGEE
jgi:isocitrate dehydrogenase kinase/phosphatase